MLMETVLDDSVDHLSRLPLHIGALILDALRPQGQQFFKVRSHITKFSPISPLDHFGPLFSYFRELNFGANESVTR